MNKWNLKNYEFCWQSLGVVASRSCRQIGLPIPPVFLEGQKGGSKVKAPENFIGNYSSNERISVCQKDRETGDEIVDGESREREWNKEKQREGVTPPWLRRWPDVLGKTFLINTMLPWQLLIYLASYRKNLLRPGIGDVWEFATAASPFPGTNRSDWLHRRKKRRRQERQRKRTKGITTLREACRMNIVPKTLSSLVNDRSHLSYDSKNFTISFLLIKFNSYWKSRWTCWEGWSI